VRIFQPSRGTTWPTGNADVYESDEYADGASEGLAGIAPRATAGRPPARHPQRIFVVAEVLRARRAEYERRERERQAALEREAKLERRRREEEARRQDLEQQVARWVKSQNLRAYLKAIEQEAVRQICPPHQILRSPMAYLGHCACEPARSVDDWLAGSTGCCKGA